MAYKTTDGGVVIYSVFWTSVKGENASWVQQEALALFGETGRAV